MASLFDFFYFDFLNHQVKNHVPLCYLFLPLMLLKIHGGVHRKTPQLWLISPCDCYVVYTALLMSVYIYILMYIFFDGENKLGIMRLKIVTLT